jgi:hypothetical protein
MTDLTTLATKDLLAMYNKAAGLLGEKPCARFADRSSALRRTQEIVARANLNLASDPEPEAQEAPAPAPKKPKAERKQRGPYFKFKPREDHRQPKPDTMRGKAFALLRREGGASLREIMDVYNSEEGWDLSNPDTPQYRDMRRRAYEGIRLMHYIHGYGLEPTGFEKARVYTKNETV